MASALPATMDEDRVAAMSASLLSLGERAAEGLGRGGLNQVYIEGESGTVFLVSADDEAVLVAVAAGGAKVGMMLYEVRRAAENVADVLRTTNEPDAPVAVAPVAAPEPAPVPVPAPEPVYAPPAAEYPPAPEYPPAAEYPPAPEYPQAPPAQAEVPSYVPAPVAPEAPPYVVPSVETFVKPVAESAPEGEAVPTYAPLTSDPAWATNLTNGSNGTGVPTNDPQPWS
jgi:predicted regulator of Ras-like GTPase activity (Roadblock/LC7/MglB family)